MLHFNSMNTRIAALHIVAVAVACIAMPLALYYLLKTAVVDLHAPILSVFPSPTAAHAVVIHNSLMGQAFQSAGAFSLVPLSGEQTPVLGREHENRVPSSRGDPPLTQELELRDSVVRRVQPGHEPARRGVPQL